MLLKTVSEWGHEGSGQYNIHTKNFNDFWDIQTPCTLLAMRILYNYASVVTSGLSALRKQKKSLLGGGDQGWARDKYHY